MSDRQMPAATPGRAGQFNWRRFHAITGLVSAPFLIITSVCGGLLLFRKTGLYERRGAFRTFIQDLHSFEILMPYVGVLAVILMLLAAVSGLAMLVRSRRRR